ncbi:MAG: hypothetical protein LBV72_10685 [Tannerella sp.]|jgi:hypothetical protein|nr:hypothetical protein [Tannerella sp.]
MKRNLYWFGLFIFFLSVLVSCGDKSSPIGDTVITVKVENAQGEAKVGENVSLYLEEVTSATNPEGAYIVLKTNEDGEAIFSLNFADMNIPSFQHVTLYFVVFYAEGNQTEIAGTANVTVLSGDSKDIVLNVLF